MLYILSVYHFPTGGPETLHQFARHLRNYGVDAAMVYSDSDILEAPEKFKIYNIPVVNKIVDSSENMLIVPETLTRYLYRYKNIRKCIWWLSRDLYYGYNTFEGLLRCAQRQNINKLLLPVCIPLIYIKHKMVRPYFKFGKDKNQIFHMYNCEYVRTYLAQHGVLEENMLYMCGPIRKEYFEYSPKKKETLIAYNPKKNLKFTKKILDKLKLKRGDIKAVGIIGMKPNEIVELLSRSSVYIDFGHFPGPERIPREAVTCYCNVITGLYGSAKNDVDVLVPKEYKFKASSKNIDNIINAIVELVDNYDDHVKEFDDYRKKVKDQVMLFENNSRKFAELFSLSD